MGQPVVRQASYEDLLQVPEPLVAEILNGELHTHPRPASRHVRAASALGGKIGDRFDFGSGGWWIIDEPELHLGPQVMVPDLAGWRRERMPDLQVCTSWHRSVECNEAVSAESKGWSHSTITANTNPCSSPTTDMRVGFLLCGDLPHRYNAICGDYPTLMSAMFEDGEITLEVFDAHRGDLPQDPSAFDGLIISGSASSVYDDEQWIRDLECFVREVVATAVPVFGICFGHQLLAQALGGTVERNEGGWGVGIHTMRVREHRAWTVRDRVDLRLVMTHQDQVVDLPSGAFVVGSSDHCENYLIEFTPTCVGIQGHPEFPAAFARAVYEDKRKHIGSLASPTQLSRLSRCLPIRRLWRGGY